MATGTCDLCKDSATRLVTLRCGHAYCQDCLEICNCFLKKCGICGGQVDVQESSSDSASDYESEDSVSSCSLEFLRTRIEQCDSADFHHEIPNLKFLQKFETDLYSGLTQEDYEGLRRASMIPEECAKSINFPENS